MFQCFYLVLISQFIVFYIYMWPQQLLFIFSTIDGFINEYQDPSTPNKMAPPFPILFESTRTHHTTQRTQTTHTHAHPLARSSVEFVCGKREQRSFNTKWARNDPKRTVRIRVQNTLVSSSSCVRLCVSVFARSYIEYRIRQCVCVVGRVRSQS